MATQASGGTNTEVQRPSGVRRLRDRRWIFQSDLSNFSVGLENALKYWAKRLRLVVEFAPANVAVQGGGNGVKKLEVRREPLLARVLGVRSAVTGGVEQVVKLVFEFLGR